MAQQLKEDVLANPNLEITHEYLESLRDGTGIVYPADMTIRTSEHRLSDIDWPASNAELYFMVNSYFPQLTPLAVLRKIKAYTQGQRRGGA
mgnify:FL=1